MEPEERKRMTVDDIGREARAAADWLVGKFKEGSWPTHAELQVFCFDNDIELDSVDQNRGQFFEQLHESNAPARIGLASWLLHDLGVTEPFDRAWKIFEEAIPDLRRLGADVPRTRAEMKGLLGMADSGPGLWQLKHVLAKSQLHVIDGAEGEWSLTIPFRLLRRPLPTAEELFYPAPTAYTDRGSIVVDVRGIVPTGLGWGGQRATRRLTDWVFVASTWEDLKDYREKVLWALLGQKRLPLGMEFWAPDGSRSIDRSMAELAKANLMVLILGCRYGSPAREGDDRSFIEIEYDTAKEHGIDVLPFLADPSVQWNLATSDPHNAEKLKAFRSRLERENHVYHYRTPDDLKFAVVRALDDRDERLSRESAPSFKY